MRVEVADQNSARRAAAVGFYAITSNVNLDPSDLEQYVTIPVMSNYLLLFDRQPFSVSGILLN